MDILCKDSREEDLPVHMVIVPVYALSCMILVPKLDWVV